MVANLKKTFLGKWMNQKLHYKEIQLIPTPLKAEVYYCSKEQFNDLLHEKYGQEKDLFWEGIEDAGAITVFIKDEKRRHIIVGIFQNSIYNASHEAVHVSWFMQQMTNIKFDMDAQETQAYYVGYITQEIGEFLKRVA